jgi:hypothetical protein
VAFDDVALVFLSVGLGETPFVLEGFSQVQRLLGAFIYDYPGDAVGGAFGDAYALRAEGVGGVASEAGLHITITYISL